MRSATLLANTTRAFRLLRFVMYLQWLARVVIWVVWELALLGKLLAFLVREGMGRIKFCFCGFSLGVYGGCLGSCGFLLGTVGAFLL